MIEQNSSDQVSLLRQQTALARFGEFALREDDLDIILTKACSLVGEGLRTDLAKVMELQSDGTRRRRWGLTERSGRPGQTSGRPS